MENGREGRSGAEPGDPPNRGEAPPARPARPGSARRGSPGAVAFPLSFQIPAVGKEEGKKKK